MFRFRLRFPSGSGTEKLTIVREPMPQHSAAEPYDFRPFEPLRNLMSQPIATDVIIVGGGISGLAAALKIQDANSALGQNIKYLVLESHPQRLGGRALSGAD